MHWQLSLQWWKVKTGHESAFRPARHTADSNRPAVQESYATVVYPLRYRDLFILIERDYLLHKKSTFRNVKAAWHHHLFRFFGSIPVVPFDAGRVNDYILARHAQGAANSTINRELSVLKRMASLTLKNYDAKIKDDKLFLALVRWKGIHFLDEKQVMREHIENEAKINIDLARSRPYFTSVATWSYMCR